MSTDHLLAALWETILKTLDQPGKLVSILGIDFSKSFNRINHNHCLGSLARLGASNEVLRLHAAFLSSRTMAVRVGSTMSGPRRVNGGCVQGCLLGILQHNVCLEGLDDDLNVETSKYMDDMSVVEALDQSAAEQDAGGVQGAVLVRALESESAFDTIKERAESVDMKVNSNKTSLLCISTGRHPARTYIGDGEDRVTSTESLKLLGFTFTDSPGVE